MHSDNSQKKVIAYSIHKYRQTSEITKIMHALDKKVREWKKSKNFVENINVKVVAAYFSYEIFQRWFLKRDWK